MGKNKPVRGDLVLIDCGTFKEHGLCISSGSPPEDVRIVGGDGRQYTGSLVRILWDRTELFKAKNLVEPEPERDTVNVLEIEVANETMTVLAPGKLDAIELVGGLPDLGDPDFHSLGWQTAKRRVSIRHIRTEDKCH